MALARPVGAVYHPTHEGTHPPMPDPTLPPDSDIPAIIRKDQWEEASKNAGPVLFYSGRSDKELAEEIRQKVIEKIQPLLEEMSAAKRHGFDVMLGIQTDAQGKSFLQNLKVVKEF